MGEIATELKNLSFSYPKNPSGTKRKESKSPFGIKNVSFRVEKNSYLTILGESGSGKTTLLHLIGGFLRPHSGEIWVDGKNVTELPLGSRGICTVFQEPSLFPHLKVWENVAFGLIAKKKYDRGKARSIAEAMLDRLNLPKNQFSEKLPHELSGGEKHRVALARALVMEPDIVLLDEPLASLDDPHVHRIEYLLNDLRQRYGITFIEVTHNQEHALAISSHIVVLEEGEIVNMGTPEEVYYRPRPTIIPKLLKIANSLHGYLELCSDSKLVFKTKGGFESRGESSSISPGQEAWLILRPESISFEPLDRYDNNCDARILEIHESEEFSHSPKEYVVSAKDVILRVREREKREVKVGETKTIWWSSTDTWLMPVQIRQGG